MAEDAHRGLQPDLIALGWDDVDFAAGVVRVRRARVESEYKVPKEKVRVRTVELIDPALEQLRKQFKVTGNMAPVEIEVVQRAGKEGDQTPEIPLSHGW